MIVQNIKTGKQYGVTAELWEKIKASGKADFYAIIQAPEKPAELKNVRAVKAKNPESDNNGINTIDDGLPSEDAGQAE